MMGTSSTPAVAPNSTNLDHRLRTVARGLRLPIILLTFVAATSRAQVSEAPTMKAAPAPAVVAASVAPAVVAPMPETVVAPAPEPVAAPVAAALEDVQGLSPQVLAMALDAVSCARSRGISVRDDLLTVIDYTLPSTEPRLWVLDLARGEVLFHELVAHGSGSGDNYATRFSNVNDSRQTSLGLFLTGGTYEGGNGYSMKLKGLDAGVNDRAEERHIVMHGAWYVSPEHARRQGRLGRSWGCPALSDEIAPRVIDTIKGGSFVFSYSGTDSWYQTASSSMRSCSAAPGGGTMMAQLAK